jgi:hypothetical protein
MAHIGAGLKAGKQAIGSNSKNIQCCQGNQSTATVAKMEGNSTGTVIFLKEHLSQGMPKLKAASMRMLYRVRKIRNLKKRQTATNSV